MITNIHTDIHTYIHTDVNLWQAGVQGHMLCSHTYTYIYIYLCVYIYIYKHTHVWSAGMKICLKCMLKHMQKVDAAVESAQVVSEHSKGQRYAISAM